LSCLKQKKPQRFGKKTMRFMWKLVEFEAKLPEIAKGVIMAKKNPD
jgi:hypothetical protein